MRTQLILILVLVLASTEAMAARPRDNTDWDRYSLGTVSATFPCEPKAAEDSYRLLASSIANGWHVWPYRCDVGTLDTIVLDVHTPPDSEVAMPDVCRDALVKMSRAIEATNATAQLSPIDTTGVADQGRAGMRATLGDIAIVFEARGWRQGDHVTLIMTTYRGGDDSARQMVERLFGSIKEEKPIEGPEVAVTMPEGHELAGVVGGGVPGLPDLPDSPAPDKYPPPPPLAPAPDEGLPAPISQHRLTRGVLEKNAVHRVDPVYPKSALHAGITGAVVVEVTIDERGHVTSARALSGHPLLCPSAIKAARQWVFTPITIAGAPTKAIGTLTFTFKKN